MVRFRCGLICRLETFQASSGAGLGFPATSLSLRRNRGLLRFRSLTVKVYASSRGDGGGTRRSVSGRRVGSFSCLEIGEIGRIVEPRRRGRRMEEALLGNLLTSFSFKRLLKKRKLMENNPSNRMFSSRPGLGVIHEPSPTISAPVPTEEKRETRAAQGHRPDSNENFPLGRPGIGAIHEPSPSLSAPVPTDKKRETRAAQGHRPDSNENFPLGRPGIGAIHEPSPKISAPVPTEEKRETRAAQDHRPDSNEKSSFERPRMGVIYEPSPSIDSSQIPDSDEKYSFERPRIGVIHQPSPSIDVQVPPEEKRETAEIDGSNENPNAPIFTPVLSTHNRGTIVAAGPWGGSGGNGWDDGSSTGIRGIGLSHGDAIGTLRVVYDLNGETFKGPKHKSRSGYTYNDKIELQFPEEFIVSVNGHTSPLPRLSTETPVVRSLTFKTNKRTFGPYGAEEGTPFNFPMLNSFIVGFHGRSNGQVLNAIGFHLSL